MSESAQSAAGEGRLVHGRYRLVEPIGRGGMGVVWRAHDELLQRPVAVKEIRLPASVDDAERELLRERTLREARAAARIDHPAAVRVFDVLEEDGHPCIVMELLRGRTLAAVVRDDGGLPPPRVAEIGLALLGALEAAHRAGTIHRDVKPGNVLLGEDGRVTLTDFGIASTAGDASLTSTGLLLGSPAYIAPERARGEAPEPASDLWSLGATLFTAVEGGPPFDRGDPIATVTAVVHEPPRPLRSAGPLAPLLDRLLAKEAAARPSVQELRNGLRAIAGVGGPAGPPPLGAEDTAAMPPLLDRPAESAPPRPAPAQPVTEQPTSDQPPEQPHAEQAAPEPAAPGQTEAGQPPSATPTGAHPHRTRRRALAGATAAVFVAAGVAGAVLGSGGSSGSSGSSGGQPKAAAPGATPSQSPDGSPSGSAQGSGGGSQGSGGGSQGSGGSSAASGTAAGWVSFRSGSGWSVARPAAWSAQTKSVRGERVVDIAAPKGDAYLRVEPMGDNHGASPAADWRAVSPQFAKRLAGYHQLGISSLTWHGHPAADLEFTYTSHGVALHALDREVFTPSGAYAVLFQAPQSRWAQTKDARARFLATFTPAGG